MKQQNIDLETAKWILSKGFFNEDIQSTITDSLKKQTSTDDDSDDDEEVNIDYTPTDWTKVKTSDYKVIKIYGSDWIDLDIPNTHGYGIYYPPITYIDVWLWLWRNNIVEHFTPTLLFEKSRIHVLKEFGVCSMISKENGFKSDLNQYDCEIVTDDPEQCVIEYIHYLVKNNY